MSGFVKGHPAEGLGEKKPEPRRSNFQAGVPEGEPLPQNENNRDLTNFDQEGDDPRIGRKPI